MKLNFASLLSLPALILCVSGCNVVGPEAVREARDSYNDAIHDTTKEQAFLNVVRVNYLDTTFFMDVTEVDATVQLQGQANTSLAFPQAFMRSTAGPFSPGHDFLFGGLLQYQESPTIRYQPLTGNALIAQISSPITVDSIASLYDSDWQLGLLLDLSVDRMAPRVKDNFAALNAMMALDSYGAIIPSTIRSSYSYTPGAGHASAAAGGNNMSEPNDALALYIEPERVTPHERQNPDAATNEVDRLWARLLRIYSGTQLHNPTEDEIESFEHTGSFEHIPRCIELRTTPIDPDKLTPEAAAAIVDHAPLLKTHSALGTLRSATQIDRRFEFVSPADVQDKPWNTGRPGDYFYIVNGEGTPSQSIRPSNTFTQDLNPNLTPINMDEAERHLGHSRRYMLIIVSDKPAPPTAFVSTQFDVDVAEPGKEPTRKTRYFYIDGRDYISMKNFSLVVQFMTMQAIPSQSPQLTPSLTVGGAH